MSTRGVCEQNDQAATRGRLSRHCNLGPAKRLDFSWSRVDGASCRSFSSLRVRSTRKASRRGGVGRQAHPPPVHDLYAEQPAMAFGRVLRVAGHRQDAIDPPPHGPPHRGFRESSARRGRAGPRVARYGRDGDLFHLTRNRPFVDGNKRVGLACCLVFLRLNRRRVRATDDEVVRPAGGVASGRMPKTEVAVLLCSHPARPVRRR